MTAVLLATLLLPGQGDGPAPFEIEQIFSCAEKALREDSKPEDWRPELRGLVERYLKLLGSPAQSDRVKEAVRHFKGAFVPGLNVVRTNPEKPRSIVIIVPEGKGRKIDRNVLLVCNSAVYEQFDDSVVVCLGDVKVNKLEDTVLFAKGKVEVGRRGAVRSIAYSGGRFTAPKAEENIIIARRGAALDRSSLNVFVNTSDRKLGLSEEDSFLTLPALVSTSKD